MVSHKKKTKILFYQSGMPGWIKVNVLTFKTFIDIIYPDLAEKLEWVLPIQDSMSDEEVLEYIEQTNTDILCTSHYLWNHDFLINQLSRIKSRLNIQAIIAGGPSIDVNVNKDFFEQHPYIDFAVYGAGEQAFADIVNHLITKKPLIAFQTSNCAWKNHNTEKIIVADYKFVKMLETSPFVHCAELLGRMVKECKKIQEQPIWLPYTLTRGCPYACTFCDWNSGLGNKVSRRKNTYQQEIDLFKKLNIENIYLADANVGQYDEDVDMIEYFAQKNLQENAKFRISGNYSKLKKENNLKMFNIMAESGLVQKTFNFSIQDINQEVLKNIDRPDVGWDVHVAMANELQKKYPKLIVKAQMIYGLPGQTPTTWKHSLDQLIKQRILPVSFINEPLPTSPALYDQEYQRKWEFEYIHSNRIISDNIYSSKIPKKSKFVNQQDLVRMNVLSAIYTALSIINFVLQDISMPELNIYTVVDDFLQGVHYQTLYNNLYDNWITHNNFYYTVNFSGQPDKIADNALSSALVVDQYFLKYVASFFSSNNQLKFLLMVANKQFEKCVKEINKEFD